MTSYPIPENGNSWWLVSGKWRRLHAIRGDQIPADVMREAIDWDLPLIRRAVCGLRRCWWMPGVGSRLGLRRCSVCSRALGVLDGRGTPANRPAAAA